MHRHSWTPRRLSCALAVVVGVGAILSSCDQFNPTQVTNPNLTDRAFLNTPDAARTWLRGVERQYLLTLNNLISNSEIASDNYRNNYTTNNKFLDIPEISYHDPDIASMQVAVARLREAADFGLEQAMPADPTATAREEALFLYYRAMSSIFAGEYFIGLPADARGEVALPATHLNSAVADLTRARSLVSDAALINAYNLAIARANYALGNRDAAVAAAEALLAASPAFVHWATYDGINGPNNGMQGLLTSSVNNLQPLPRLDFLDPKYPFRGAQVASPLAVLKAEEAHLILAEAALSTGDVGGAKSRLLDLLVLVGQRPVEVVDSRLQVRGRAGGNVIYPNHADYRVAFRPGAPFREGLVLTRQPDFVPVPTVSGTSVNAAQIAAAQTHDEVLYLLYLMRQEIFLGEGRRMFDLGLRYPVVFTEVQTNPNVVDGEWYTVAQIPSFIPGDLGMDSFDLNEAARTVVIHYDMNRVLVDNRTSPEIFPFHN